MTAQRGTFIFSLDAELAWGHYDRFHAGLFSPDGSRERWAIEQLLDLFDEFQIVATWAFVGHLFFNECEKCTVCPILEWRGKYDTFKAIYETAHPLWYGADIVRAVLQRKMPHEIAFHGYTHRIFDEGLSEAGVRTEIEEWLRLAARQNLIPRTVIFPRNQINYLDLFQSYGFSAFRGEETQPTLCSLPFIGRVFRRYYYELAALLPPPLYEPAIDPSGLVNVPSSRWLFGFNRKLEGLLDGCGLHTLRLRQIVQGIRRAGRENLTIHLWAHPFEFRSERDVLKLRYLLGYVAEEIDQGRMRSVSISTVAHEVLEQRREIYECVSE